MKKETEGAELARKKFKQNESDAKDLLNKNGYKTEFSCFERSCYDLWGYTPEGVPFLAEVKGRKKDYDEWVMEKYKADNMNRIVDKPRKAGKTVKLFYICVLNGKHYMYDVDDITKINKTKEFWMPKASTEGFKGYQGDYVRKNCYLFPKTIYKTILNDEQ